MKANGGKDQAILKGSRKYKIAYLTKEVSGCMQNNMDVDLTIMDINQLTAH